MIRRSIEYPPGWAIDDIAELEALFDRARAEGLWFYHGGMSGPLWFTPDELHDAMMSGNFRWGAMNWELRQPAVRLEGLRAQRREIEAAIADHIDKWAIFVMKRGQA